MDLRNGSVVAVLLGALALPAAAPAAPPPNDSFANRQELTGTSASVPGTTVEATLEAGEPNHFAGNSSVWYTWTPPQDMVVKLDTCGQSSSGTKIQLWSGSAVGSLTEIKSRNETPSNCTVVFGDVGDVQWFSVTGGTTYAISVIEFTSDRSFTLTLSATPTPANDKFANAQDLGEALDVDADGTTVGTTVEPGESGFVSSPDDRNSVWYRWTAPKRTRMWIDNCSAETDSRVEVFKGASLATLTDVEFDNSPSFPQPPSCPGNGSNGARDEFLATGGTTYMIRVRTEYYESGAFHLQMRDVAYDASVHQTASAKKIKKGRTVTFTIDVENVGTVTIESGLGMVTSKPNHLTKPVKETKYLSVEGTNGTKCKPEMMLANPHPGASCEIKLDPGESTRIVAKVRPDQSLSHWTALEIVDDNLGNEDDKPVNVTVKPKRRRR